MHIRQYYPKDRLELESLMIGLQQYIADIDPLKRNRSSSDFDCTGYFDYLLSQIENENGSIFVAEDEGIPVGFVAGTVQPDSKSESLGHYPTKEGQVVELIVSEKQRGKQIGKALMEKVETYLKSVGCDSVRVGCFAPNRGAHAFYEKCGYSDRYIEMLKVLE